MPSYAEIIIDISHEKVDHPFTYAIPEVLRGEVLPGSRVTIPFGRGNTLRTGYVTELMDEAPGGGFVIKEIAGIAQDPGEDHRQIALRLALWMKHYYGGTTIQALKTVLPAVQKVKPRVDRYVRLAIPREEAKSRLSECIRRHQVARARVIEGLLSMPRQPYGFLTEKLRVGAAVLKAMEKAGILVIEETGVDRTPITLSTSSVEKEARRTDDLELSPEQQATLAGLYADLKAGRPTVSLIYGVTGSGKTEIYLRLIQKVLEQGRQAIVLIPEIALTYQTLLRFYARFGERVSVIHSGLSAGERYDQMLRAERGEVDVIIGPRSALFVPFARIGVIVMDEEHESSYKSEVTPRYHARETAIELARLHGAMVVLGSATPSLEAFHAAREGRYRLYTLTQRATRSDLARVRFADLRQEMREGNRSIFSRDLQSALEDRLSRGEQSMLFLNRRGYVSFINCRSCGYVVKCPHCDVSLSEHLGGKLICHYCGFEMPRMQSCPECGSPYIGGFKAGTQQIEEQVRKLWPRARVLRMDADTTRTKNAHAKILSAFANEEADVLVGTQMIVKGHDFPKVTLVGIILADLSLGSADFRAAERSFQLLTQAEGRAGRGELPGEVILQSYDPEHYALRYAARQDYEGFYEEEAKYRRLLQYPPASHMLGVLISHESEDRALSMGNILRAAAQRCEAALGEDRVRVLGPSVSVLRKLKDQYRFVIYIKGEDPEDLIRCRTEMEKAAAAARAGDPGGAPVLVGYDTDPMGSL